MKNFKIIYFLLVVIFVFNSCEDVLEQDVEGVITTENALNRIDGTIAILNSSYGALTSSGAYDTGLIRLTELASDNGWTERQQEIKSFQLEPNDPEIVDLWESHYSGIARANLILSTVDQIENANMELITSIKGQCHFLRALYYFNLTRLIGEVPLIVDPVEKADDAAVARTSVQEIYNLIISDLKEAQQILPSTYDGSENGLEVGRATSGSATALLAKVFLTIEDWQNASVEAAKVIGSNVYDLHNDYAQNFQGINENGIESIFEVQFSDQSDGTIGSRLNDELALPQIVQGNGLTTIIPTNDTLSITGVGATGNGILQAFENGDLRKSIAMSTYGIENQTPVINKYYAGMSASPGLSPVNVPILRYAEILLIQAEALNEIGSNLNLAIEAINRVRLRAGLNPLESTITNNQSAFRDEIRRERRRELCFEHDRFFDLNRWGILVESMLDQGIEINSSKVIAHPITGKPQYLYPVPINELTTNPNTTQNPGY